MRDLTTKEQFIIQRFAEQLGIKQAAQLLEDMKNAFVESTRADDEVLVFSINGYQRPPYNGQDSYHDENGFQVEASMYDDDGGRIEVLLYSDQNKRLLELEYIKWGETKIIKPKYETLVFDYKDKYTTD